MVYWEHFHHQADIGVRGCGDSMASAFEQAALGMTAVIADLDSIADSIAIPIHCEAQDRELLLCDWLNALIYEMATRKLLFRRFSVTLDGNELNATAWGETIDPLRHQPVVEIKGATYTEPGVEQDPDGNWIAQCVVDV